MKKWINAVSIAILLSLTGCFNLSFDALEYDRFIQIKEQSELAKTKCANINSKTFIADLKKLIDHQEFYTSNRQERENIKQSTATLKLMVDSLYSKETYSQAYCEEKLDNISKGSLMMIQALGNL